MITIRRASDRGHADHGWLDTYHTFSFADYRDPAFMGFRSLRVINEDRVQPGQGFGMHFHRDMEIVTYVLEGALEHKDSMGNGEVLRAGEFQRMTAGTGIEHSEFNPSATEAVHLYQIWLLPAQKGLTPGYEQKAFAPQASNSRLLLVAAPDGKDGALTIRQDACLFLGQLSAGAALRQQIADGRSAWLQVLRGAAWLNGQRLAAGDGAAISGERLLDIVGAETTEVLLFDLA